MRIASSLIILTMLFSASYSAIIGFGKGRYIAAIIVIQMTIQSLLSIALLLLGFGVVSRYIGHNSELCHWNRIGSYGDNIPLQNKAGNAIIQTYA